jgi:hypothetical protein
MKRVIKDMTVYWPDGPINWPECLLVYTCEADQPGRYYNKVAKIPCDWIFDTVVGFKEWGEEIDLRGYQQEIKDLILKKMGDRVPEDQEVDILVRKAD